MMNRCVHFTAAMGASGLIAMTAMPAAAAELDALRLLSQTQFRALAEDVGAVLSYKGLVPAEPLGVTGFDIAASVGFTTLGQRDLWRQASPGTSIPATVPVPALRVWKGLPGNVDIGAVIAKVGNTDIGLFGGELRWAFVPGSITMPAVAVRGAFTRMTGAQQLDVDTRSLDLSISKGILNFTPYAGVGRVWTRATPNDVPGLVRESFTQDKIFAGLNVNLGVNLAFEVDRTGGVTSYGIKAGVRF